MRSHSSSSAFWSHSSLSTFSMYKSYTELKSGEPFSNWNWTVTTTASKNFLKLWNLWRKRSPRQLKFFSRLFIVSCRARALFLNCRTWGESKELLTLIRAFSPQYPLSPTALMLPVSSIFCFNPPSLRNMVKSWTDPGNGPFTQTILFQNRSRPISTLTPAFSNLNE